jgi:hypothetical protein
MNLLLPIAEIWTPEQIKKRELRNLFAITAAAFGSNPPSIAQLSFDQCLIAYADFTKIQADLAIARGDDFVHKRLFDGMYRFGKKYRRLFSVSSMRDLMRVSRLLYAILGIDFQGDEQGVITIRRCFFSRCYSADTCRMISSLDAGLLAGLGGILTFSQRITEGFEFCSATLTLKDE